ncbi:MAG: hypothetical protein J6S86_01595 [Alphaproteobacteria bacterium]|nr:hypothetical protein [Alphaproteobacteria bacterium]
MNSENIVKTFRDNKSAESEKITKNFIEKNDRLKLLKNEAFQTIENTKVANDNQAKGKN